MTTTITVCETCTAAGNKPPSQGDRDGSKLADLITQAGTGNHDVIIRRHACLMGCDHGCNVALQANGKLTYVMGRFTPATEDAAGIVEYATKHAESETGQVPFKQWPQAIKGHFIARLPVLADSSE